MREGIASGDGDRREELLLAAILNKSCGPD